MIMPGSEDYHCNINGVDLEDQRIDKPQRKSHFHRARNDGVLSFGRRWMSPLLTRILCLVMSQLSLMLLLELIGAVLRDLCEVNCQRLTSEHGT